MGIVGFCLAQYLHHLPHRGELLATFMGVLGVGVLLHGLVVDPARMKAFFDTFVEGYQRGARARSLVGPRWELMFERSLAELRLELQIPERAPFTAASRLEVA